MDDSDLPTPGRLVTAGEADPLSLRPSDIGPESGIPATGPAPAPAPAPASASAAASASAPRPVRRAGRRRDGVEANARLTGSTAALLFVLLAAEGVTILRIRPLLSPHVFIGMLLVPPVLLKFGSTMWRFARYYRGDAEYRAKGPPPLGLRLLGPLVVVLTFVVFATGIVLLLGPSGVRSQMLQLHKISFILWLAVMSLHVLGHLLDTARLAPRDWARRSRRQIAGAGMRQWAVATSVALGLVLAVVVMPRVGPWLVASHFGHHG